VPDPDPEPLPEGGYDDAALAPWQGKPDAYRCHGCNGPKSLRHGALICRICDAPPLTPSE
jgi:hypothetical protein